VRGIRRKDGSKNKRHSAGDNSFDTIERYQIAMKPQSVREKWKKKIESYAMDMAAAYDRAMRAQKEAEGVDLPDIRQLETLEGEATEDYKNLCLRKSMPRLEI
jgi:hypothetical protein